MSKLSDVGRDGALLDRSPREESELRRMLAHYRRGSAWRSLLQLGLTLLLFVGLWAAMWWSLAIGYWLTLLLAVPASGMVVRLFILQHDCGHGSLFASPAANRLTGVVLSGITMTPYQCWRRQHSRHHATNGQLDHRGMGDVTTLTVAEFRALTLGRRWLYRVYRHPLVLFGVGPILHFGVLQRFPARVPRSWTRERASIHGTNLLLLCLFALAACVMGPLAFMMIHLPTLTLAASAGTWLFYVQHQFNPTYWERDDDWDHHRAAVHGSSFLDLPWPLRWVTANIGFHHIHHLDSRIPNYALPSCHQAHPVLQAVERLTVRSSLRCLTLKLWDEDSGRMVSFREAARLPSSSPPRC